MTEQLDIAAIRARADAATEGPWKINRPINWLDDHETWLSSITANATVVKRMNNGPDADFIAAARTDAPALCDEVERLRAENAKMREALNAAEGELEELRAIAKSPTAETILHRVSNERDQMREVLEWYANPVNYADYQGRVRPPVSRDQGQRAREALK